MSTTQTTRPTSEEAPPIVDSSAGSNNSPQAIVLATPRDQSPAGAKTGRDHLLLDDHPTDVSAPHFPGDQGVTDLQWRDVAGDQDQPTAIAFAASNDRSPSADDSPPAAIAAAAANTRTPQVGDPFLALAADVVDDLEKVRIANENRLRQLTRSEADADGEERGFGLTAEHPDVARLAAMVAAMLCDSKVALELGIEKRRKTAGCCLEHDAVRNLERTLKTHPLGPWVKATKGVGEKQAARLLAKTGDPYIRPELTHEDGTVEPSRPRTVSELWAYCGYKPGQRRRKGIKSNWSAVAKSRAFLIAQAMLKAGNREIYDARKAATEGRVHTVECVRCGPSGKPAQPGTPWSDGHRHADALRVVAKEAVLKELWREAKRLHDSDIAEQTHNVTGAASEAPEAAPHKAHDKTKGLAP